jgi:hypothetical protein
MYASGTSDIRDLDAKVFEIAALKTPASIQPLLGLLDDKTELQDFMFSIIHAAEGFDHKTYAEAVLDSLPTINRTAPRWTQVLHARILNTDSAREAYLNAALQCRQDRLAIVREVLADAARRWPRLGSRVAEVLATLERSAPPR